MSLVKRLLSNGLARRCICVVVASYIWLVRRSGRWTVYGGEGTKAFLVCRQAFYPLLLARPTVDDAVLLVAGRTHEYADF